MPEKPKIAKIYSRIDCNKNSFWKISYFRMFSGYNNKNLRDSEKLRKAGNYENK